MTPQRRGPRPLGHAFDVLLGEVAPQTLLAEVQRLWNDAVGGAIAAEAQPTGERGGVVIVSCSASVWAQELDLMAPAIIERVNALLGAGRIVRLRCVAIAQGRIP